MKTKKKTGSVEKSSVKVRLLLIYPVLIVLFAVSLFFTPFIESVFNLSGTANYGTGLSNNALKVYYADAGQGDLSLIITPERKTVMIDSSTYAENKKVEKFLIETLLNSGITEIDYIIVTHPDEDHIGNFPWIFANFQVYNVYLPKISYEKNGQKLNFIPEEFNNFSQKVATNVYKNFLTAAFNEPNCNKTTYIKNEILDLDETLDGVNNSEVEFKFISQHSESQSSINNFSPVMLLTYKSKKFLWTGDANTTIENRVLSSNLNEVKNIDIYKAGHHGSNSSSGKNFLEAMKPSMVIVSCSENNSYGHPGAEFLKRCELLESPPQILKTYDNGDILIYINADGTVGTEVDREHTSHLRWYMIVITAEFFLLLLCINDALILIRKRK